MVGKIHLILKGSKPLVGLTMGNQTACHLRATGDDTTDLSLVTCKRCQKRGNLLGTK